MSAHQCFSPKCLHEHHSECENNWQCPVCGNTCGCNCHRVVPSPKRERVSVILANLTAEEIKQFHDAKLPYTGSTALREVWQWGSLAPYIATVETELPEILTALGWKEITLKVSNRGDQWIVRRMPQCSEDIKPPTESVKISANTAAAVLFDVAEDYVEGAKVTVEALTDSPAVIPRKTSTAIRLIALLLQLLRHELGLPERQR